MHGNLVAAVEMEVGALPLTYTARRGFASISPLAALHTVASGAVWRNRRGCAGELCRSAFTPAVSCVMIRP